MRSSTALLRFIVAVVAPSLLIIALVHWAMADPPAANLRAQLDAARGARQFYIARDILQQLIEADPTDLDRHFEYIEMHFRIPTAERDDELLFRYYETLAASPDPALADTGFYGEGLIRLQQERYQDALDYFDRIQNRQLKYLNSSLGLALLHRHNWPEAERALRRAIELQGHTRGAVPALAHVLRSQRRFAELRAMADDPAQAAYMPAGVRATAYAATGSPHRAAGVLLGESLARADLASLLAAALIALVWFLFLKRLDIFEPEKNRYLILTFALGFMLAALSGVLYDIARHDLGMRLNGNWLNDLFYCVFAIGMIEEALKFLPLVLMLRFTRQVNESIDPIIYAGISAIGFACAENVLYFRMEGLTLLHARALSSVLVHIFCSAVVAYGLVCCRYREGGRDRGLLLLGAFLFACLLHGIYDFWLVSAAVPEPWRLVTVIVLVYCVVCLNRIINNALNHSEFFNERDLAKLNTMRAWLGAALAAIIVGEYALLAGMYGPTMAAASTRGALISSWIVIYFLSFALGNYRLAPRVWVPLLGRLAPK